MAEESTNPKDALGIKKPNLHLVPPSFIIETAEAFRDGARKYGPYNWRDKKVSASVYQAAALRHLLCWYDGEDVAWDSKVHHLAHAAACLAIIIDAQCNNTLVDDRPTAGAAAGLIIVHTESSAQAPAQDSRIPNGWKVGDRYKLSNGECRTLVNPPPYGRAGELWGIRDNGEGPWWTTSSDVTRL